MSRKITVGLSFDFYPDGEHKELFEDMTDEQIIRYAKEMANEDIINGDVWEWLEVTVTEEE